VNRELTLPRLAEAVALHELEHWARLTPGPDGRGLASSSLIAIRDNTSTASASEVRDRAIKAGATPHPLNADQLVHDQAATMLAGLQTELRALADAHGFPERLTKADLGAAFDRAVASRISSWLPSLSPSEASQDQVWHFITAFLVPDVGLWRWPPRVRDLEPDVERLDDDADDGGNVAVINAARLLKSRRHWLKDAWRRAFVVPSRHLEWVDADLWEQIRGRPTLFGDRAVVGHYLDSVAQLEDGSVQDQAKRTRRRSAAARLYRRAEVVSFFALSTSELADVVAAALEDSAPAARTEQSLLERFVQGAARIGIDIEPALRISLPDPSRLDRIRSELRRHRNEHQGDVAAREIEAQCSLWIDSWMALSRDQRHVVLAVVLYFLLEGDERSDSHQHGLDDDRALTALAVNLLHG
jgi:hypothetical protein